MYNNQVRFSKITKKVETLTEMQQSAVFFYLIGYLLAAYDTQSELQTNELLQVINQRAEILMSQPTTVH